MVQNCDALCEDDQERVIVKVSDNAFASDNRTLCVGPQNFKKIRFLGKGSHGRVYSVKSVVCHSQVLYCVLRFDEGLGNRKIVCDESRLQR